MAKQTLEPGDVGFEEIDFVAQREVSPAKDTRYEGEPFRNALVCGTRDGEKSCAYIEDVGQDNAEMINVVPMWWGLRLRVGEDAPDLDVSRTADEDDYMMGPRFDVRF